MKALPATKGNSRAQPQVVVSVVNWNTPKQTLACVNSLRTLTCENTRVIVVDNGSQDDSAATIRDSAPEITLIASRENLGFAGGHALALQQAQQWGADAIWLVNSDAIVETDALTYLLDAWLQHGDALYGGAPLQKHDNGSVLFDFPAKLLPPDSVPAAWCRDREIEYEQAWATRGPTRVGSLVGSTMLIPLRIVAQHGWLDSAWFMYCEEIDYCYRLRKSGIPSFLIPMSRVWHHSRGSQRGRPGVVAVLEYYRARNEVALARRHAPRLVAATIAAKNHSCYRGGVCRPTTSELHRSWSIRRNSRSYP